MNRTKKIIALLLTAAFMFAFPVSAYAINEDAYVDGFYNSDDQYCLRIGKFGVLEMTNALSAMLEDNPDEFWLLMLECKFSDGSAIKCSYMSGYSMAMCYDSNGNYLEYEDAGLIGAQLYSNDTGYVDSGFVLFFENNAAFLETVKASEEVEICAYFAIGDEKYAVDESVGTWHTIATDFQGFETDDEPVADEPIVDEPIEDEPVVDEPIEDEPVVDEPATDEPVADEPATDEPVADEPVVDEPVIDEPATNEPVVDTNVDVDSADKTSPDTGMGGIAAAAAVSVTALGAAVLSKKRK